MSEPERIDWRDLPPIPESEQPEFRDGWMPSQTFLRTHDNCDRAALLYLQYGGGASTHELNRGSIFHLTAERLLRLLVAQGEVTVPPELARVVLYEVMGEHSELQVSAEERDVLRYLVDHWARGTAWQPANILGIEKTLTLETGGFRVLMRPDVIEEPEPRVARLVDHKTAFPPDSEEFRRQAYDANGNPRFAGNYQLAMGSVVAAFGITDDGLPLGNFERFQMVLEYPRILRDDGIDKREIEVDRLQVQSFRDDLDLQLKRLREVCIAKRKWQATAGTQCRECPAAAACPLPPVLRPESEHADLHTLPELEAAATDWNLATMDNEVRKRRLKKAAESLPDEDLLLGTNEDGEPILGVRCGTDQALAFEKTARTEIPDKENLFAAAEAAAQFGEPFRREDHVKRSEGVSFVKRKLAP